MKPSKDSDEDRTDDSIATTKWPWSFSYFSTTKSTNMKLNSVTRNYKNKFFSSSSTTLIDLPKDILIHYVMIPHLSGEDCRALACVSKAWYERLKDRTYSPVWRSLYEARRDGRASGSSSMSRHHNRMGDLSFIMASHPPRFPWAGTWRDVYLRALKYETLVVIYTLTHPEEPMVIIVSRGASLYSLKRMVREKQKQIDGFALEDFELMNQSTGSPLGVRGNDSLPPPDLGRLFWDPRDGARGMLLNGGVGNGTGMGHRGRLDLGSIWTEEISPWRRSVGALPDGSVFFQAFAHDDGSTTSYESAREQIDKTLDGFTEEDDASDDDEEDEEEMSASPSSSVLTTSSNSGKKKRRQRPDVGVVDRVSKALDQSHATLGPDAFKTFWAARGSVHPLLQVSSDPSFSFWVRLKAAVVFFRCVVKSVARPRFLVDVLVRSTLTSGFFLGFTRLCFTLFPVVWNTQIKRILDADFDFVFGLRLMRDVVSITVKAFYPVVRAAIDVELLRVVIKSALIRETPHTAATLAAVSIVAEAISKVSLETWKKILSEKLIQLKLLSSLFPPRTKQDFRVVRNTSSALLENLYETLKTTWRNYPSLQYTLSAALWTKFDNAVDPAVAVSVPVFAYAVPIIACAVVLRVRVFLASSYLSLLLM